MPVSFFCGGSLVHVDNRAANLCIGKVGLSAACRHAAMAVDRGAHGIVQSVLQARYPRILVANPRRSPFAILVALAALSLHDLVATALGPRRFLVHRLRPVAS